MLRRILLHIYICIYIYTHLCREREGGRERERRLVAILAKSGPCFTARPKEKRETSVCQDFALRRGNVQRLLLLFVLTCCCGGLNIRSLKGVQPSPPGKIPGCGSRHLPRAAGARTFARGEGLDAALSSYLVERERERACGSRRDP